MDFILGPKTMLYAQLRLSYIPDDLNNNLKLEPDGKPLAFEPEEIIVAPGGWRKLSYWFSGT